FIDPALRDYPLLVSALGAGDAAAAGKLEIVLLDGTRDGIAQIGDYLESHSGIAALHIFSHGSAGSLTLGTTVLDAGDIDAHADRFAAWRGALAGDADILIYACATGAGTDGELLLTRIAKLTGADVAGSTDPTGSAALGGNWLLEAATGPIEADLPATPGALAEYPRLLANVSWDGGGDGVSWSDPLNWSNNLLPGAGDDVSIAAAAGDPAINIGNTAGLVTVNSLNSSRPLTLGTGATLQAASSITMQRNITLNGGTISGGTLIGAGGAKLVATGNGGTLNGVTLQGQAGSTLPVVLDATGYPNFVTVTGNLTLDNAKVNLQNYGRLDFTGATATLGGNGQVFFGDNNGNNGLRMATAGGQLTIGAGITVTGSGGTVGYVSGWGGSSNVSVVNLGNIGPDRAGSINIAGSSLNNLGTLSVNGGSLNVATTTWTNAGGTIAVASGTLNLGGTVSTAQLGSFARSGGTVNFSGTLNNGASTFTLDASRGSWNLTGGTINGGTIEGSQGAALLGTGSGGLLNGVTLKGAAGETTPTVLDVRGYPSFVSVAGDLTLDNATINLQNYGHIDFSSAAALLGGSGKVVFGDNNGNNALRPTASGAQLTLGAGITVSGSGGTIGYASGWGGPSNVSVLIQGTVGPTVAGGLFLAGASLVNQGTLLAGGGGTLNIQSTSWDNSAGTLNVAGGTVNLGGGTTTARLGTFTRSGGTLNLTGTLDNSGASFTLGNNTGSLNLVGGTILGGTVVGSQGAKLLGTGTGGTLNAVTLQGGAGETLPTVLDVTGYPTNVGITGSLTLANATVNLQNYGRLDFTSAAAALNGNGRVFFGDNNSNNGLRVATAGGQLTLGAGVTVTGSGGTVGHISGWGGPSNVSVVNLGSIGPDRGGTIFLTGTSVNNQGSLVASGGGTLALQPASWTNAAGASININTGSFTLAGNYNNAGTINASNATVNLGGNFTLAQLGSFTRSGGTVNLTGTLDNSASTLTLDASTGSWNIAGGSILGGTVIGSQGARLAGTSSGGTLNEVTLQGGAGETTPTVLDLNGYPFNVSIAGNLTLANATINLQNYGHLDFISASSTLGGNGRVFFGDNNSNNGLRVTNAGGQLSVGAGVTVTGSGGTLGYISGWGGPSNVSVINQGSVGPDRNGTIILAGSSVTNQGSLVASGGGTLSLQPVSWTNAAGASMSANGGTLTLGGSYSNLGNISATNATVNLGGSFTLAQLGNFTRSGGNVNLTGTLNNAGSTLALDATTGSWNLVGGSILGGTVAGAQGAALLGSGNGGSLNNVTLQGAAAESLPTVLDLNGYPIYVTITGTLTLANATVGLQNYGHLDFSGASTQLDGSGRVLFGDNNGNNALRVTTAGGQLTLGAGINVTGAAGTIGYASGWGGPSNVSVVNLGSIGPEDIGTIVAATITIAGASLSNQGTLQASGGGTLNVQSASIANFTSGTLTGGTWRATGSSVLRALFGGPITTNAANIVLDGTGANFYRDAGTTAALDALAANAAAGHITLANGASFITPGDFSNAGTLSIGAGSLFQLSGLLTQTGGTLDLQGGSVGEHHPPAGNAMQFDGANDYIEMQDSPSLHSDGELTLSGWFKADSFPRTWQNIIFKGDSPDPSGPGNQNREYGLWLNSQGYLYFSSTPVARVGVGELTLSTPNGSIQAGQWYHFAAVIS
ncbi:MAG: DUF4347 domain-containing protein, partial [Rhodocyclaceae bacterium]|nr:DUF4347 domain-containing protein [Rhodocyclaceae bacterium]